MTAVVDEVETDKLERLARMYNQDIQVQIAKAREALEAFASSGSYSNWLTYLNINTRIGELMVMRNAMRTHSDSFRERFPTADDVINQP